MFDNEKEHQNICNTLHEIYVKKNHDYGDSFAKNFDEYGLIYPEMHIKEKFDRFKSLRTNAAMVTNESIEDTLLDMANYCILTVLEMKKISEVVEDKEEDVQVEEEVFPLARAVRKTTNDREGLGEHAEDDYLYDDDTDPELLKSLKSKQGNRK